MSLAPRWLSGSNAAAAEGASVSAVWLLAGLFKNEPVGVAVPFCIFPADKLFIHRQVTWQSVNPCTDENDAAGMMAALSPLHAITEAGAAVLLAHHPRKGDASEAQASRGSGALPGFVDTIVELRRFNAQEAGDRRRKLRGYGRFDETAAEVVIELTDDGYVLVGSTGDANRQDRFEVIRGILSSPECQSAETIRENWPTGDVPKPGLRTLQRDLNYGAENGQWMREGKGRKGDQYRYRIDSRTVPPLSTGNEKILTDDWGEV